MSIERTVVILLLNWNGFDDTVACVKSIHELTYKQYVIVVVDNASQNSEGIRLKQLFPNIHLIQNETNRGFTGGNNVGLEWAKKEGYSYVWVLNNDTIVDKDALTYQMQQMDDKKVGAVGSKIKICGTDLIWSKGLYLFHLSLRPPRIYFFSNIGEGKLDNILEKPRDIENISGCSMLLNTEMASCFFADEFFTYCEDMDICHRIRKEGYAIRYEPRSIVYHKVSRSTGGEKFNPYTAYYSYRNKLLFLRRTFSFPFMSVLFGVYVACLLRDVARILLKHENKKDLLLAVGNGVKDGLLSCGGPATTPIELL